MSAAELDPQGCCSFMDIQRQQQRQNPGLQGAGCKKDAERIGEKEEKHSMRSEKVSTAPAPGCHQGSDTQAKGTLLLQHWWNFKAQQRNWVLCQKTFISCVACWVFSADSLKALSLAWSLINFHSFHSEEGNQCQEPWGFHSMSLPVRWDLTVADSTAMALVTGTTNCQSWTLLQIPVPTGNPIVKNQLWDKLGPVYLKHKAAAAQHTCSPTTAMCGTYMLRLYFYKHCFLALAPIWDF